MKKIIILFILGLIISGCKSKKTVVEKKPEIKIESPEKPIEIEEVSKEVIVEPEIIPKVPNSTEAYILAYKDIAMEEMREFNIPASITLAQGILESGSGKGRLAVEANNHFGIKCHEWTGDRIYHDDDESQECFRKYANAKYSYDDHSLFLVNRKRYSKLFSLRIDDYKAWAKELKNAGYATDRKYPDKLISLIERFELYKYDEAVLGTKMAYNDTYEDVKEDIYIVVKGDTLYSISKKFNLTVAKLQEINDLEGTGLNIGQVLTVTLKEKK